MLIRALLFVLAAQELPSLAPVPLESSAVGDSARRIVHDWLVIAPLETTGRRPFRPDAVFEKHLLDRASKPPVEGEALKGELSTEQRWTRVVSGARGEITGAIGWAYASVESADERVVIAKLAGAGRLYVNGAGFVGDAYAYGFGGVPIPLAKGRNDLFVTGVRGAFTLELLPVDAPIFVVSEDVTRPDAIVGSKSGDLIGAVGFTMFNATDRALAFPGAWVGHPYVVQGELGNVLYSSDPGPFAPREWTKERLVPLVPVQARVMLEPLRVVAGTSKTLDSYVEFGALDMLPIAVPLSIEVRSAAEARRVTYVSHVDESLQQYALLPAGEPGAKPPRVVLSLHGAGVDAFSQARAYSQKADFWIVCPTNRRPFGFDWQDWGRHDADEVMIQIVSLFERRGLWKSSEMPPTYVTGHSMGGHGTWHVTANDPWSYQALAPSAGWCSFDTYGARPAGELRELWLDADAPSRTLDLIDNLRQLPAYVLHGTADDNVPVSEGKAMVAALEKAGAKPRSHFEEGALHWWDGERAAGADCVDWPEIFDHFRATPPRESTAAIDFTCVDPAITARFDWAWILQQRREGKPSRIQSALEDEDHVLRVTTENVRRAYFMRNIPKWKRTTLVIDGTRLSVGDAVRLELLFDGSTWRIASPDLDEKRPARKGPFKHAFEKNFLLVYGTLGSGAECREMFERARCDLETWWYRANGTPEIVSDIEFVNDRARYANRNVILYGNAESNAAWTEVLPASCPLEVRRGSLKLGGHEWKGDDLAAAFVFPMKALEGNRSDLLVGVFADTGARGARIGYTLSPFTSGVGYPDYAVFSSSVLASGDGGVLAAGWFDHAWKLDPNQFVRAEER